MRKNIAIIGSGISGLSAAWLLSRNHRVTIFEKGQRVGGHANTRTVLTETGPVDIDTGFIVYNEVNYPNLTALFGQLDVATAPSEMSFSVSLDGGRLEYSGDWLPGLFGQKRNLVRVEHWLLVRDILRFFRSAETDIATVGEDVTIADFLRGAGYSDGFIRDHILPLSAAIWSTPSRHMLDFPARAFIRFFANHGLLQATGRPEWRTVRGGSINYVERLIAASVGLETVTGAEIASVRRHPDRVELLGRSGWQRDFDDVLIATDAPTALNLLADPDDAEKAILSQFRVTTNHAVLHSDPVQMPRRRHLWQSWNYARLGSNSEQTLSVTYWMNALQPLETETDFFLTLNPNHEIEPDAIHYQCDYAHPLFDARAMAAQRDLSAIQGRNRTWFAGAWQGYGFHEDGLQSGLEAAERIGGTQRPWKVRAARERVAHAWGSGQPRLEAAQ